MLSLISYSYTSIEIAYIFTFVIIIDIHDIVCVNCALAIIIYRHKSTFSLVSLITHHNYCVL